MPLWLFVHEHMTCAPAGPADKPAPKRREVHKPMKIKQFPGSSTRRVAALIFVATIVAGVTGCTNTVHLRGQFPAPLVEKVPLTVGLHFPKEFKNYTAVEILYQDTDWRIPVGYASEQMFEQVFTSLADKIVILDKMPEPRTHAMGADLIVVPAFADFGLLDPDVSHLEFFSISFKYRVRVITPNGQMLADWEFNSYGKAPWYHFNEEGAVREALMTALRDAAATLATEFDKQPGIAAWMRSRGPMQIAGANDSANEPE